MIKLLIYHCSRLDCLWELGMGAGGGGGRGGSGEVGWCVFLISTVYWQFLVVKK